MHFNLLNTKLLLVRPILQVQSKAFNQNNQNKFVDLCTDSGQYKWLLLTQHAHLAVELECYLDQTWNYPLGGEQIWKNCEKLILNIFSYWEWIRKKKREREKKKKNNLERYSTVSSAHHHLDTDMKQKTQRKKLYVEFSNFNPKARIHLFYLCCLHWSY